MILCPNRPPESERVCSGICTYNSLNQLIKVESISSDDKKTTENIVWENNRIIEISYTTEGDEENAYIKRFTYSDKKCEGFCPLFFLRNCNMLAYAHPELMGIRCNQLPDSEKFIRIDDNGEEVTYRNYTYSYTFDNDGYVTSCTQKGLNIYAIVTFTWLDY